MTQYAGNVDENPKGTFETDISQTFGDEFPFDSDLDIYLFLLLLERHEDRLLDSTSTLNRENFEKDARRKELPWCVLEFSFFLYISFFLCVVIKVYEIDPDPRAVVLAYGL